MAFQFNLKPSSIAGSLDSFSFDQTDNKAPTATTESASRQLLDSKKPEPKAVGPGRNSALLASIDDIGLDDSSAADGAAAAPSASSIFLQEKRAAQAEAAALAARAAAQPAPAAAAPAPKSARDDRMLQLIEQHSRDQQDIVISRKQKGKELSKAQRKRKEKAQERGANYSGQQSGKQQVRPPPPGHAVCCRFCLHANQPAPRSPAIQAKEASTKAGQKPVLNQPAWWQWSVSRPPPPAIFPLARHSAKLDSCWGCRRFPRVHRRRQPARVRRRAGHSALGRSAIIYYHTALIQPKAPKKQTFLPA